MKKEYEMKIKSLYKSVWVANLHLNRPSSYNIEITTDENYFIRNKYYVPYNIKDIIVNSINTNKEFKNRNNQNSSSLLSKAEYVT